MIVVIFRATIKALDPLYFETASRLRDLAFSRFGCIALHSVTEGNIEVTLSYWPSEEHIRSWRAHPEHVAAQQHGRTTWYESYSVEIARIERQYEHRPEGESERNFGISSGQT